MAVLGAQHSPKAKTAKERETFLLFSVCVIFLIFLFCVTVSMVVASHFVCICTLFVTYIHIHTIAIKCSVAGTYDIDLSQDDFDPTLSTFPRGLPTDGTNSENNFLFEFVVSADDGSTDYENRVTTLPQTFPAYTSYLQSLIDEDKSNVHSDCPCYSWTYNTKNNPYGDSIVPDIEFDKGTCSFTFQAIHDSDPGPYFGFNNHMFNMSMPPEYYMNYNEIYEINAATHTHPLHQHVNPFQLTQSVSSGLLGQKGDWFDTFASMGSFTYRTRTADFDDTNVVVHCHNVLHEDQVCFFVSV